MDLGSKDCEAFVAGASSLGKACAKALIDEGVRVFICSRGATELEKTAAEIRAAGCSAADVSQPREVQRSWPRPLELSAVSTFWSRTPADHLRVPSRRSATRIGTSLIG